MINYQVMTSEQMKDGKYYPNYELLLNNAQSEEEKEYIKQVQKTNFSFAYNMVYITQQICGHFEIFQTPCNIHYPLYDNLQLAQNEAKNRKCTACICQFKPITRV